MPPKAAGMVARIAGGDSGWFRQRGSMVQPSRLAALAAACIGLVVATQTLAFPKLPTFGLVHGQRLKSGEWPQAHSNIAADPDIRFGTLPNGMRYALRHTATPPGQTSLRLRIDVGSLMESDTEQGLAHFLEHLAFDGSRAAPEGQMAKILERHGLVYGADNNAETTFDATTYRLDLPKSDDETVDTALTLLRETASELTLSPSAIDRERGVILAEAATRDTPAYRIFTSRLGFLLEGQSPPLRLPIGKIAVIQKADHAALAAFYARYYRPERATVVAVGDFDVAALEAKIRVQFGSWRDTGPGGAEPDLGEVEKRGAQTRLLVEPGGPTSIQLAWVTSPDVQTDSEAKRKADLIEQLGLAVLNRRLSTLARADNPPFLSAAAFRVDELHAARVTSLLIGAEAEGWQRALAAADQEQRRLLRFGPRPEELAREIAEARASLRQSVAQAATRPTPGLADELADTLENAEVATSPSQDLALFEETVKALTPAQVNAALQAAFEGSGPLLYMSSPIPIDGGEAAIQAAYDTARAADVTPATAVAQVPWPYGDFGDPGKVVEQREIPDLDAVFVRFENGVRLTVKPTKSRAEEVEVKVRVAGGLAALPPDRQSLAWAASALVGGGFGKISVDQAERALASHVYSAGVQVEDDAIALTGTTRRDDLDTQLQVLAAYVSDPGWRPEAFQRTQLNAATLLDQYAHTDFGVLDRDLPALIHAGDRRWSWPTREEMAAATVDDVKAQMAALGEAPLEVIVVGDITVDKAIEAVAATFGALPARPGPATTGVYPVRFPAPNAAPVILTHAGEANQAIGFIAWPTQGYYADPRRARVISVLGDVLRLRLIDVLRQSEGVVYAPQVADGASLVWPGYGYLSAQVEIAPARLDAFQAAVARICDDLRGTNVTPDELERARGPRLASLRTARQNNAFWLASLSGAQADPRRLDAIRSQLGAFERITAADLQSAAQSVLRDDRAWRLEVRPASP
jgi:zinc protease